MKRISLFLFSFGLSCSLLAQRDPKKELQPTLDTETKVMKTELPAGITRSKAGGSVSGDFVDVKRNMATPVKNQQNTGTCWSYSTTSLIESQSIKNKLGMFDLSEMFFVRNMYVEKARNYILRQGNAQFSEGGLGHDVVRAIAKYGAMPQSAYSGLKPGESSYDHSAMFKKLKAFLDSNLKTRNYPINNNWIDRYNSILDSYMGPLPAKFTYESKSYTAQSFAREVLGFNAGDYVNITSFTHHPFYEPFIVEVPDNFSNGAYYNLPLQEMIDLVNSAVAAGYTIMWDADVSNAGFMPKRGLAMHFDQPDNIVPDSINPDMKEARWSPQIRQQLFEGLSTQDDHLMHLVGTEKSKGGKPYFIVKNSWGDNGPYGGYVNVSESYFAINTISLVVPKAALSKTLLDKLKIQ